MVQMGKRYYCQRCGLFFSFGKFGFTNVTSHNTGQAYELRICPTCLSFDEPPETDPAYHGPPINKWKKDFYRR